MTQPLPEPQSYVMDPDHPHHTVAIGLGSSLGDRAYQLQLAVRLLSAHPRLQLDRCSRWYRSPPMRGGTAEGWFLNGVVRLQSTMAAVELLAFCRQIEDRSGRRRAKHWGDRTLDLDLLLVDDSILTTSTLTLPHPAIASRSFVRQPLLEVWPDARDPITQTLYRDHKAPTLPRAVLSTITLAFQPTVRY